MITRLISFIDKKRGEAAEFSAVPETRQQLLVDISVIAAHDAKTGIQRVVRALWLMLQNLSNDRLVVRPVFATPRRGYCYAADNFLGSGSSPPAFLQFVTVRPGDIFFGLDLAAHLLPRHEKQIAGWQQAGARIYMLVYDLLPFTNPEWFSAKVGKRFGSWLEFIARRADCAICISGHVAAELQRYLSAGAMPRKKEFVIEKIRLGFEIDASAPNKGRSGTNVALLEAIKGKPNILMVGTIEPRKGYDSALDAFEWLWRTYPSSAPNLIIVGKPGWKTEQLQKRMINHAQLGRKFVWLDNVSDELLEELYATSAGFLTMSRAEGFGLPVVEALSHDLPILARDLAVFRELGTDGIEFFSDEAAATLGPKLLQLAAMKLIEGWRPAPSQLTTWSQTADDLLKILGIERDIRDAALSSAGLAK